MALGYKVALLSVWWKRGEVDTRFFSSKQEQKTYFDNLISAWSSLMNFNINDNITTTITYRDTSGRVINELLKCNYAVIQDKNNNYRYYFITSIMADSNNQIIATLDLDDIQNNLIGNVSNFNPIYVKNWTGNNYKFDSANSKYYYDFTSDKTLQNTGDAPQLFTKETTELFMRYTQFEGIDKWLNDNIEAWRYVFVNQNNRLGAPLLSDKIHMDLITSICFLKINNNNIVSLPYGAVSCPIYKASSNHKIYIKFNYNSNDYYMKLDSYNIDSFFNLQDGTLSNYPIGTYGIEEKISNLIPYYKDNVSSSQFEIDEEGDLIINAFVPTGGNTPTRGGHEFYYMCILNDPRSGLTKVDALGAVASGYNQTNTTLEARAIFQPTFYDFFPTYQNMKLFDINYSKMRVRIANQFYDYNPLAYFNNNSKIIEFKYSEALKVGVSKIYLRPKARGEYKNPNDIDYTGLITSLDLTEPLLTNQWADYLASHKNYYLQTAFNNVMSLTTGMASAKNSGDSFMQGFTTFGKTYNQQLERENMQQSPNGLANANGDPYFNMQVNGIKPHLDFLTASDNALEAISSKFKAEGVPYNRYFQLSHVINCHSRYTYLSCIINSVNFALSTKEFERLKTLMSNGLRFWYVDTPSLTPLNYYKEVL